MTTANWKSFCKILFFHCFEYFKQLKVIFKKNLKETLNNYSKEFSKNQIELGFVRTQRFEY